MDMIFHPVEGEYFAILFNSQDMQDRIEPVLDICLELIVPVIDSKDIMHIKLCEAIRRYQ